MRTRMLNRRLVFYFQSRNFFGSIIDFIFQAETEEERKARKKAKKEAKAAAANGTESPKKKKKKSEA